MGVGVGVVMCVFVSLSVHSLSVCLSLCISVFVSHALSRISFCVTPLPLLASPCLPDSQTVAKFRRYIKYVQAAKDEKAALREEMAVERKEAEARLRLMRVEKSKYRTALQNSDRLAADRLTDIESLAEKELAASERARYALGWVCMWVLAEDG